MAAADPRLLESATRTLILEEQCDARQRDAGCKHEPAKGAPVDPSPYGDGPDLNAQPREEDEDDADQTNDDAQGSKEVV